MKEFRLLYIIGNGFDIAHGLKTKYSDFKTWLRINLKFNVIEELQSAFPCKNGNDFLLWSHFEKALGSYNINRVLNWGMKDLRIVHCTINGIPVNCNSQILNPNLVNILKTECEAWIRSISISNLDKKCTIDKNAYFLTFNYTDTLEKVYDIPEEQVFHIHGRSSINQRLIIGHNRYENPYDIYSENLNVQENNTRFQNICDINNMRKTHEHIIELNRDFFSNLKNVNEVKILGHSCSEVDNKYFLEVNESIARDAIWNFKPYSVEDKRNVMKLISYLDLDKRNIRWVKCR